MFIETFFFNAGRVSDDGQVDEKCLDSLHIRGCWCQSPTQHFPGNPEIQSPDQFHYVIVAHKHNKSTFVRFWTTDNEKETPHDTVPFIIAKHNGHKWIYMRLELILKSLCLKNVKAKIK